MTAKEIEEKVGKIRLDCMVLFPEMEAKLKEQAEKRGEKLMYGSLDEAMSYFKEFIGWMDDVVDEIKEQS